MKNNLLFALLFISFGIHSQSLVLTQAANEPAVGDVDTGFQLDTSAFTTGLHMNVTGANSVWNFTNLKAMNPALLTHYVSPATVTSSASFSGCTVVQDDGVSKTFIKSTSSPTTQTEILGLTSSTLSVTFTNSAIAAKYPVSFSTTTSDNISGTFSGFSLTGNCTGSITTTADGTGTLMLPNGLTLTNVLRVKSVQSLVFSSGFIPLATGKQIIYNYYHASRKFAVLSVNYTSLATTGSTPSVSGFVVGSSDHFVPVGIKENAINPSDLSIFPNPFENILTIGLDEKFRPREISIYTQLGQLAYRGNYSNTVDLATLPAGIYFVELKTDVGPVRKKVIKE